ncbi:MAG TPA: molybdopterin-dependent oxidoreductase [Vicinamibacterales bacterium]|nr:molybdopterin-dependent oxidoreductase [Vicinamibacterales bacterium]
MKNIDSGAATRAQVKPSRREMLGTLAAASAITLVEPGEVLARLAMDVPCAAGPAGELLGTLPLFRNRVVPGQFGVKYDGVGLDARLDTDLSLLEPDKLITPNELAYIRTEIPAAAANHQGPWTIETSGLLAAPAVVRLDDFTSLSKKMGPHLFECSGNGSNRHFGLMSVAEWEGIPLAEFVARLKPSKDATGVLVSGYDHVGQISQRSIVGASWVFPLADLDKIGAFLAIRMNGEAVPPDHGKPVRLAVPGWYGCSWIKWVNEVRLVGPDEPATSQMVEFAARTHQSAPHKYARDYSPADIQTAATPVRVEKRRGANGLEYRIVGILWGGTKVVDRLQIRFGGADQPFTPFTVCPTPKTHVMWQMWEYRWKPTAPGVYDIALEVADQSVPQRRLKSLYYMRQVRVEEV